MKLKQYNFWLHTIYHTLNRILKCYLLQLDIFLDDRNSSDVKFCDSNMQILAQTTKNINIYSIESSSNIVMCISYYTNAASIKLITKSLIIRKSCACNFAI